MKGLTCPYCYAERDVPEECHKEDEVYEAECSCCDKNFVFTVRYSVDYNEYKADCLNGSPHKWERINGCPSIYFAGRRRCSDCDNEIYIEPEADEWKEVEKEAEEHEWARNQFEKLKEKWKK